MPCLVALAVALIGVGCSGTTPPASSTGGTTGGNRGSGGAAGSGGDKATGGTTRTGGTTAAAGGTATGGNQGSGGATLGGSTASGGKSGTGGSSASGGNGAAGGMTGTGGTLGGGAGGNGTAGAPAGGTTARAGATGTGGIAPGGATGSGGARTGGTGAGGTSASGGTTGGTGGSTIVAATPPMGWNSWNNFGCSPSESLIKKTADAMVSSGMAAVGYQYVNIDDCWMSGRSSSGELQWDTSKFPSGMSALADYVHGKGLKLGIYETPSSTTCAGKTGGAGHESQDAKTFASWGIDYLKYDHCKTTDMQAFVRMGDALKATGRPIVYSINPVYGSGSCIAPPNCAIDCPKIANLWRIEFDINASWGSFTGLINTDSSLAQYASPGHWNDPDMLEVGRGMSADEDRSHFGMWAILAAPLITGNDLSAMTATTKAILTNKEVIDVDQDPLGKQGTRVATSGSNLEVWSKVMSGTN
ncbi:MAG TPA: glycoside hydrolase family 27 protein, partial [Polyangia bacterium]